MPVLEKKKVEIKSFYLMFTRSLCKSKKKNSYSLKVQTHVWPLLQYTGHALFWFHDLTRQFLNHESCLLLWSHTFGIIVILDLTPYLLLWYMQLYPKIICPSPMKIHYWSFFKNFSQKVNNPKWPLTPHVDVSCVTLPKDHCAQLLR